MKTSYTYTILRYVHDVASGEFANVGVVLLARDSRFAGARCRGTYSRLTKIFPGFDGESFRSTMGYIERKICAIGRQFRNEPLLESMPPDALTLAHMVLPHDDSALQWSDLSSGITDDPATTLDKLYERFVTKYDVPHHPGKRDDEAVWRQFKTGFDKLDVTGCFAPKSISVADDEVVFNRAWKNEQWHCMEPLSFDLTTSDSIAEKAHRWLGQITSVKDSTENFRVYFLVGAPQLQSLQGSFARAINILNKVPVAKEIIREDESDGFTQKMSEQIRNHNQLVAKTSPLT